MFFHAEDRWIFEMLNSTIYRILVRLKWGLPLIKGLLNGRGNYSMGSCLTDPKGKGCLHQACFKESRGDVCVCVHVHLCQLNHIYIYIYIVYAHQLIWLFVSFID